ncbi:MAG: glycosyltransferase family 4 protein [Anaerolineales bacterium]|nr:glycosyltransferase family 4 protein [Anaerolineales bacterium]
MTETYYPVVGGGETQARLLAEGLVARGHSVLIVTRRSDPGLKNIERYGQVAVHRLGFSGNGQLKKWGLLLSTIPALIRLRGEYDWVFVSGFRIVGPAAVLVSKLFRKGSVLKSDSQGEMSGEYFESGLKKIRLSRGNFLFRSFLTLRNSILRKADAFSAISDGIADEYRQNGVDPRQIHRIPNCVDMSDFYPVDGEKKRNLRDRLQIPRDAVVAVYTGRLVSYKGLPLLVRVWDELSRGNADVLLLLVGTGGLDIHNCEPELKGFVRRHQLEGAVRFTGSVDNVPEYLQAADIFVLPTEDDAFPSSLVEAMAAALPAVSTPVGAIQSIISDGQNGLLVDPGEYKQLHGALQSLIDDPDLRSRLGTAAWETVQENYSADTVTEKYLHLYQAVVDKLAPGRAASNL